MKKAELIFIVVALLTLCGTLFLLPTSIILIPMATWLAVLYFPLGFAFFTDRPIKGIFSNHNGASSMRIAGAIGAGLALSMTVMGILYSVMWWPGAFIMLSTGLMGSLLVGVIAFIRNQNKEDAYYTQILKRVIPYLIVGSIVLFFSEKIFLEFKYRDYPDFIEMVKESRKDPMNRELKEKVREERAKIMFERGREK